MYYMEYMKVSPVDFVKNNQILRMAKGLPFCLCQYL